MTLRLRLTLSLAAIAVLLALPLALAFDALREAERAAVRLRDQGVEASLVLARTRDALDSLTTAERALVLANDSVAGPPLMQRQASTLRGLADAMHAFDLKPLSRQLRVTASAVGDYGPHELTAVRRGDGAVADSISEHHVLPAIAAALREIGAAERVLGARAAQSIEQSRIAASTARHQTYLLFGAAAAGALAIAIWLTRSISRPVQDLEAGMAAVADGRFGHRLTVAPSRSDEFGRLAESYRQMAARLAELDKLRAEFVSIASHELKTPINVLLGYATLLRDELYGPVSPEQRKVLGTLEAQGQSLSRLVQRLLDLSRFQAGGGRLEVRPLALRPFLGEVEAAHAVLAARRDVAFRTVVADGLPEAVTWDGDRVREVLDNLLTNAVKFTGDGGSVELSAAPYGRAPATAVRISVRDTGVGIPPEQLTRIFDKFFQASNQQGAAAKGTGLGLAISKAIVDAHGGTITVDSAPGAGSQFSIVLPITASDAPVADPSAADGNGAPAPAGIERASVA